VCGPARRPRLLHCIEGVRVVPLSRRSVSLAPQGTRLTRRADSSKIADFALSQLRSPRAARDACHRLRGSVGYMPIATELKIVRGSPKYSAALIILKSLVLH